MSNKTYSPEIYISRQTKLSYVATDVAEGGVYFVQVVDGKKGTYELFLTCDYIATELKRTGEFLK